MLVDQFVETLDRAAVETEPTGVEGLLRGRTEERERERERERDPQHAA